MAKQTRAPARRGRALQSMQRPRKTTKKVANKTAKKLKRKKTSKTARKSAGAQTMQASLARRRVFTPELLAYVRRRFEQTPDSMADIALDLGISREAVRLLGKRERWKRYVRPPHGLPPAVRRSTQEVASGHPLQEQPGAHDDGAAALPQAGSEGGIPPLPDTVARLHRAVLDELAAIETLRTHSRRAGISAHVTRTLASLTETLQKLQRMQLTPVNSGPDDADMPADIDEFRNELARRIELFVIERTDAGDRGGAVAPPMDAAV
jgi:hypothetical protein